MLNVRVIFTADPDNIDAIFGSNFSNFEKGAVWRLGGADLLGKGIFTSDEQRWRQHRKLLHPYSTVISEVKLMAFEEAFQSFVHFCKSRSGLIGEELKAGQTLCCPDISNVLRRLQLDTNISVMFGEQLNAIL